MTQPNHVWSMDIPYVPMAPGFVYLAALVDAFSRKVLSWRLAVSMDSRFCKEAVEEALTHYGKPAIFNTDQVSPFTSTAFTNVLKAAGIAISVDGRETGATTSLSSDHGGPSSKKKSISTPTTASLRRVNRSAVICKRPVGAACLSVRS